MRTGSLGNIIFETGHKGRMVTPHDFKHEMAARYEEHKVLGDLPRLEFLAPELANMSLNIRLRADMGVNPTDEAEKLCAMCAAGQVARFILAGVNLGNVVIESVNQTWRLMNTFGAGPYIVDLDLKLKEYV